MYMPYSASLRGEPGLLEKASGLLLPMFLFQSSLTSVLEVPESAWHAVILPSHCQKTALDNNSCTVTVSMKEPGFFQCLPEHCDTLAISDRGITLNNITIHTTLIFTPAPDTVSQARQYFQFYPYDTQKSYHRVSYTTTPKVIFENGLSSSPLYAYPIPTADIPAELCNQDKCQSSLIPLPPDFPHLPSASAGNIRKISWGNLQQDSHSPIIETVKTSIFMDKLAEYFHQAVDSGHGPSVPDETYLRSYYKKLNSHTGQIEYYESVDNQQQRIDPEREKWVTGLEHIKMLDRLFGVEGDGGRGFNTPHNSRHREVMEKLRRGDLGKERIKKTTYDTNSNNSPQPDSGETQDQSGTMQKNPVDLSDIPRATESPLQSPKESKRSPSTASPAWSDCTEEISAIDAITSPTKRHFVHKMYGDIQHLRVENLHIFSREQHQQGNAGVIFAPVISRGLHRFAFSVIDQGASMCIGPVIKDYEIPPSYLQDHSTRVYWSPGTFLYRSYQGMVYRNGKESANRLPQGGHGRASVKIICEVNMDERKVRFKNS